MRGGLRVRGCVGCVWVCECECVCDSGAITSACEGNCAQPCAFVHFRLAATVA